MPPMWIAFVRRNKVLLVLCAVLLAAGLFLSAFHTHQDLEQTHKCSVCHFVRQITAALVLLAAALFCLRPASAGRKLILLNREFSSLFFAGALRGRAPPFPF